METREERIRIFHPGLFKSVEAARSGQCLREDWPGRRLLPLDYENQGWSFKEFQIEQALTAFGMRYRLVAVFSRRVGVGEAA